MMAFRCHIVPLDCAVFIREAGFMMRGWVMRRALIVKEGSLFEKGCGSE